MVEDESQVEATAVSPPRRVLLISAGASHSVALLCKQAHSLNHASQKLAFFCCLDFYITFLACPFGSFAGSLKIWHLGSEKFVFLMGKLEPFTGLS